MSYYKEVQEVKREYVSDLMAMPGVVAVGVGFKESGGAKTGVPCVVVSVIKKLPRVMLRDQDLVPFTILGIPTDVQEVGLIRALDDRTGRWRPAPGGVSIGHKDITAGTLGCLVRKGEEVFILSNNHVLANSNLGQIGDEILQPGQYDGGTLPDDVLATLADYVPVKFILGPGDCPLAVGAACAANVMARLVGSRHRLKAVIEEEGTNLVDAALGQPLNEDDVQSMILEIGQPLPSVEGQLGMAIRKSGRTTGLTEGEITQTDVTISVVYPPANVAVFEGQFMAGPMSSGGDSGSLVVDAEAHAVGLLFAGSDTTTIFSPIAKVEELLGVEVWGG